MRLRFYSFASLLVALLFTGNVSAQALELGVKGGFSVYTGDLSPTDFSFQLEDVNFAGGGYLRYRPWTRFGIRVDGTFGRLSAEREFTIDPGTDNEPVAVERNFRSTLTEFSAVLEYDLIYFGDYDHNYTAFYLFGGVGVLSFNPQGERDGNLYDLQPLRTEGQGLDPTNPNYASTPYELTTTVGIVGAGLRTRFAGRVVLGLEAGLRIPGTDYLDDIGDTRVRYVDVISGPGGTDAGYFSNPAITEPGEIDPNYTYIRGGEHNDYYFVGGLTLGITIGGGGSNKTGCYSF